jgi:hypothetical protein
VTWWISVTSRRIVAVAKVGTCYSTGHLGLINPFATTGEWPYPMFIAGSTATRFQVPSSNTISTSGFMDPVSQTGSGPAFLRTPDGAWVEVYNSTWSGTSRTSRTGGKQVGPAGNITSTTGLPSEDQWFGTSLSWGSFIPTTGNPGTQINRLLRASFTSGDRFIRLPGTIVGASPYTIDGEIEGCFWFDAAATGIVPENRISDGDERFTVFQNGVRGDNWSLWALREG